MLYLKEKYNVTVFLVPISGVQVIQRNLRNKVNLNNASDQNRRNVGIQQYSQYYTSRDATDDPRAKTFTPGRYGTNFFYYDNGICVRSGGELCRNRVYSNRRFSIPQGHRLLPLQPSDFAFDVAFYW